MPSPDRIMIYMLEEATLIDVIHLKSCGCPLRRGIVVINTLRKHAQQQICEGIAGA